MFLPSGFIFVTSIVKKIGIPKITMTKLLSKA
ncbi:hypothetical protein BSNT_07337 [Bacillus subtilis subsp. natto BEST195]|nr:hypothetical protein BSNT_07337 [Bacillus subtilis subsp. natto BEST195]